VVPYRGRRRAMPIPKSLVCLVVALCLPASARGADDAWKQEWGAARGFAIERDAGGFQLPTAIAFVPQPGPAPDDPLYFVTELGGTVKVVTNDRSVHVFATDFMDLEPEGELPHDKTAEIGLAGICLDPVRGRVFVTFPYQDADGVLRNAILRFESEPGRFSLEPSGRLAILDPFRGDVSWPSHQIGPCAVDGDFLYVNAGDAEQRGAALDLDSTLGKVLRMTPEGAPAPGNPFRVDDDPLLARNYVWGRGFRNPFSLSVVEGRVFVVENGMRVDAFLEVPAGLSHEWYDSDWSVGMNAPMVLYPSVGAVQLAFLPDGHPALPPGHGDRFYLATSGPPAEAGPSTRGDKAVLVLDYDRASGRMRSVPSEVIRYQGDGHQAVVGLAVGPDGLYAVHLFPDARGETHVLRIVADPDDLYPVRFRMAAGGEALLREANCLGCHTLRSRGAAAPSLKPELLYPRLHERLHSPEYLEQVARVDALTREPFPAWADARRAVLEVEGRERVRRWIRYRVLEPRFDQPDAQMPASGLDETRAEAIATWLVDEGDPGTQPWLVPAAVAGGLLLLAALGFLLRRGRR
jgi:hypothetical protein